MSFFQRLCSAPFPPVSCSFPEPHPDPQGCPYNLLERQPENSWEILYNIQPLILPNTGHTGDLGNAQTPVRGVPGGHHALTCLGIGLQKVVTPQPVRGSSSPRGSRRSSRLNLPRDPILGRPSHLNLPRDSISRSLSRLSLPGDLHPDPGTPGSRVATVLGRMNLHHIYSRPRWAKQTS